MSRTLEEIGGEAMEVAPDWLSKRSPDERSKDRDIRDDRPTCRLALRAAHAGYGSAARYRGPSSRRR